MKKINYSNILTIACFVIAALVIDYFFPNEGRFRYKFFAGKPWSYELLTAPVDFPVYKTDEEVNSERDSVRANFEPYFRIDTSVEERQMEKLRNAFPYRRFDPYLLFIEENLQQLYAEGIISHASSERLQSESRLRIKAMRDNVARTAVVDNLHTVRTAYEAIMANKPAFLSLDSLRSYGVDRFLAENMTYDEDMSAKVLEGMLHDIPVAIGMVQAGERIVDRGEIVDANTYTVLRSLRQVMELRTGDNRHLGMILIGQTALVFGIFACFWLYLWSFRRQVLYERRNAIFLLLCITAAGLLTEICVDGRLFNVYILPYAIVPIVVRTFFDSRTAMFTHLSIVLMCSLMVPNPHEFVLLQTIAGMVAIFGLKELSERSQLIRCAFFIYLAYALSYAGLFLFTETDAGKINWLMFLYFGINFILLTFAYLLVYMLEKTFGYVSNITFIELSNINKPLLRKLSEVAPGTFQHSMQASILASKAVEKIGGNASLVRTGALYHDIGKIANPAFFIENQKGINPHDNISFEQSAQIVIGHVTEGIKLAEKASLPSAIKEFILTHHGHGKAKYFYINYKKQHPEMTVDEAKFTYPGPNPSTKETAVLMMADAVEAASRSLSNHTEEEITTLVERIIDAQQADGLLKNAPLTFADIELVKQVFIEKLKIAYHTRISYPEEKK
ncbi:MAG: HDIG domain-containing protein [Tannerellaceae bacterium]|jgi:putative nucleotidyltransferase with HDIG domain|nr:HDIG domain-containing protein [Tannerellaceae bacterium]